MRRHDGQYCWMRLSARPFYAMQGDFGGYIGVAVDLSAIRSAQEALRESEAIQRAITRAPSPWAWRSSAPTACAGRETANAPVVWQPRFR